MENIISAQFITAANIKGLCVMFIVSIQEFKQGF